MNRIENIKSIEIVRKLNILQMSVNDHYYSGDKDTYREAFDVVMEKYNLDGYYDISVSYRHEYGEKYREEIIKEYDILIIYGIERKEFLEKVEQHLIELIDEQKLNFTIDEQREYSLTKLLKNDEDKTDMFDGIDSL